MVEPNSKIPGLAWWKEAMDCGVGSALTAQVESLRIIQLWDPRDPFSFEAGPNLLMALRAADSWKRKVKLVCTPDCIWSSSSNTSRLSRTESSSAL